MYAPGADGRAFLDLVCVGILRTLEEESLSAIGPKKSAADIAAALPNVRFTSESRHRAFRSSRRIKRGRQIRIA
jgi:hypothetical protein